MLYPVVVLSECGTRVVGRINEDALYGSRVVLLKSLQGEEVISKDQQVVEYVLLADSGIGVIGLFRILQEDSSLQSGAILLPDPRQLQLLVLHFIPNSTSIGSKIVIQPSFAASTAARS